MEDVYIRIGDTTVLNKEGEDVSLKKRGIYIEVMTKKVSQDRTQRGK